MSPGLDSILDGLRDHDGIIKNGRAGIKADEVVIRCDYAKASEVVNDNVESAEIDDLIWWSWDEKIVGFRDL